MLRVSKRAVRYECLSASKSVASGSMGRPMGEMDGRENPAVGLGANGGDTGNLYG